MFAKKQLSSSKDMNVAGAILYIGKFGTERDKCRLLDVFNKNNSFLIKRHCLIAIQELTWNEVEKIKGKVPEEHMGTYKYLNDQPSHEYIIAPKEIKFYEIFNQVGFYA
jgi:hypothetical protein